MNLHNKSTEVKILNTIQSCLSVLPEPDKAYWQKYPSSFQKLFSELFHLSELPGKQIILSPELYPEKENARDNYQYDVISTPALEFISSEQFRWYSFKDRVYLLLLAFDHETSTGEVEHFMASRGLYAPTEADALRVGKILNTEFFPLSLVFLHGDNTWIEPGHSPQVLIGIFENSQRVLKCIRYCHAWKKGTVFAARIPNDHPLLSNT